MNALMIIDEQLTVETLARKAGLHPATVERCIELGLLEPGGFSASTIGRLRSVVRLHDELGINYAGISVILDLLDRLREVRREYASLRAKH